jgi:Acyl-CoA dehydrogenases
MTVPWREMGSDEFRKELRGFLADHPPGRGPRGKLERLAWQKWWRSLLFDAGVAGPSWPVEYGGMDLPFTLQVIYHEEMNRARAPEPPGTGVGLAGPTIFRHGSPEQRERWLRPMLRGDQVWAQAFSEPEAGSDLASLRTTARIADGGDVYIVNGQKVWSSYADLADLAFTLVRTGTPESRARGITYLVIDLHAPGVTVRPLRDITGGEVFCEIFFDDVRVPVANRIGAENDGWSVARTTLGHERAANAMNQSAFYRRILDDIVVLARERGLLSKPGVVDALANLHARASVMRIIAMRTISDIIATGDPGPASSVSRLIVSTFEQDLHEFALDMLGPDGLLSREDPDAVQGGRWIYGFLRTRASTIGAGTAEIHRNLAAERVLGLPKDPVSQE